jgi:hypothetical protein
MKNTISLFALAAVSFGLVAVACGDDDGVAPATSSSSSSGQSVGGGGSGGDAGGGGTGGGAPMVPVLGAQGDRMGRPAINTALNNTFLHTAGTGTPVTAMERDAAEDEYNADDDNAGWAAAWGDDARVSLALIDSLDADCTNGIGSGGMPDDDNATNYGTIGTVLMNDWLIVKGDGMESCGMAVGYLAVEAAFLGIDNDECGGRMPSYDVIDYSYAGLAAGGAGILGDAVPDGVEAGVGAGNDMTFPYLADATANDP